MPSRRVQFAKGEYYHIFNRGVGRGAIYRDDVDYMEFLRRLKQNAGRYDIRIIAYCLIPNHFHLLVRQDETASAGTMVQYISNGYAQWFNRRHQRNGTLFQGRFEAIHVDEDGYLRHLCRYIHGNPVRHGIAMQPALWDYSNYRDWVGLRPGTLVDHQFVINFFGTAAAYTRYLMDYLTHNRDVPEKLQTYLRGLEE